MTPTREQLEDWIAWLEATHDPDDWRDVAGGQLLKYLRGQLDNSVKPLRDQDRECRNCDKT